jgi:hypothetical protein
MGLFTVVEQLSELREIHSAEKYAYLSLFPDAKVHRVLHPSFVILHLGSMPENLRVTLVQARERDEQLGVDLVGLYVFEDAETRFCRIATSRAEIVEEFPPPPDYDPYAYAKAYILYLRSIGIRITESTERSLYEMLDPARITLEIRVVDPLEAEFLIANMGTRTLPPPGEGIGVLGETGPTPFEVASITKSSGAPATLEFSGRASPSLLRAYWHDGSSFEPRRWLRVDTETGPSGSQWTDNGNLQEGEQPPRASSADVGNRYYYCLDLDKVYLQDMTATSVKVMWLSGSSGSYRVEYSSDNWATTLVRDHNSSGSSSVSVGQNVYVFTVHLTQLTPDTSYQYRAFSSKYSSAVHGFRTPAASPTSFRFVVYGDNRSNDVNTGAFHPDHLDVVAVGIATPTSLRPSESGPQPPVFGIHVGDYVNNAGYAKDWQGQFFQPASPLIANIPLFPCIGNHEYSGDDGTKFLAFFDYPKTYDPVTQQWAEKTWYSFNYGNCHFIFLDTRYPQVTWADQEKWLTGYGSWQGDLPMAAANPEIDWIFLTLHVPPYTDSEDHAFMSEDVEYFRGEVDPIVQDPDNEVAVVFSGHNHLYERSFKLYQGSQEDGVHYVVTGGGGAPFHYPKIPPHPSYTTRVWAETCYNHCTVDVSAGPPTSLTIRALRNDGSVLDIITLPDNLVPDEQAIIAKESTWSYYDLPENEARGDPPDDEDGVRWISPQYDESDSTWLQGGGPLGYGDPSWQGTSSLDEFDVNNDKVLACYFRKEFTIAGLDGIDYVSIDILRDDGCAVYMNGREVRGREVVRSNMPPGPVDHLTLALEPMGDQHDYEKQYHRHFIDKSLLLEGTNVIAVEVHQVSDTSSDLSFDLAMHSWRQ